MFLVASRFSKPFEWSENILCNTYNALCCESEWNNLDPAPRICLLGFAQPKKSLFHAKSVHELKWNKYLEKLRTNFFKLQIKKQAMHQSWWLSLKG